MIVISFHYSCLIFLDSTWTWLYRLCNVDVCLIYFEPNTATFSCHRNASAPWARTSNIFRSAPASSRKFFVIRSLVSDHVRAWSPPYHPASRRANTLSILYATQTGTCRSALRQLFGFCQLGLSSLRRHFRSFTALYRHFWLMVEVD